VAHLTTRVATVFLRPFRWAQGPWPPNSDGNAPPGNVPPGSPVPGDRGSHVFQGMMGVERQIYIEFN